LIVLFQKLSTAKKLGGLDKLFEFVNIRIDMRKVKMILNKGSG